MMLPREWFQDSSVKQLNRPLGVLLAVIIVEVTNDLEHGETWRVVSSQFGDQFRDPASAGSEPIDDVRNLTVHAHARFVAVNIPLVPYRYGPGSEPLAANSEVVGLDSKTSGDFGGRRRLTQDPEVDALLDSHETTLTPKEHASLRKASEPRGSPLWPGLAGDPPWKGG